DNNRAGRVPTARVLHEVYLRLREVPLLASPESVRQSEPGPASVTTGSSPHLAVARLSGVLGPRTLLQLQRRRTSLHGPRCLHARRGRRQIRHREGDLVGLRPQPMRAADLYGDRVGGLIGEVGERVSRGGAVAGAGADDSAVAVAQLVAPGSLLE